MFHSLFLVVTIGGGGVLLGGSQDDAKYPTMQYGSHNKELFDSKCHIVQVEKLFQTDYLGNAFDNGGMGLRQSFFIP